MKIELRNYIVPTIPIAVLLMLVISIVWFTDLYVTSNNTLTSGNELLLTGMTRFFSENFLISSIISLIITAINAFLLGQLNNKFTIIRTRSFLPILFFVLLIACWHDTHNMVHSHGVLTLILLSMFVIFSVYRDRNAAEQSFLSSFLIALGSIFIEPVILYIPLIWVALILFHSFSLRNFLATLIGMLLPWIIYVAVRYYLQPDMQWLTSIGASFELGLPILSRPLNELIYMAMLFVIFCIGLVGLSSNINQDSMQTRSLLHFNTWLLVLSFVFSMIFVRHFFIFLPFVAMSFAILLSHPLTLKKVNFFGYVFVAFLLINIAFVISNIILIPK